MHPVIGDFISRTYYNGIISSDLVDANKKLHGLKLPWAKDKIAIFCDGDFFHGYDLTKIESNLKKNKEFWSNKIETNRRRDNRVNEELVSLGYIVLRYWEHEIRGELEKVLNDIHLAVIQKEKQS